LKQMVPKLVWKVRGWTSTPRVAVDEGEGGKGNVWVSPGEEKEEEKRDAPMYFFSNSPYTVTTTTAS
jgi:hypothetical protein